MGSEQAASPWPHVCSNFVLSGVPHFPCQDPPLPQQLASPFFIRPHIGHAEYVSFQQKLNVLVRENRKKDNDKLATRFDTIVIARARVLSIGTFACVQVALHIVIYKHISLLMPLSSSTCVTRCRHRASNSAQQIRRVGTPAY